MVNRPVMTDRRADLIKVILSDRNETEAVKRLSGDDAQSFVDVIDEVLICSFVSEEQGHWLNSPSLLSRRWKAWRRDSGKSAYAFCARYAASRLCFQYHYRCRFATTDREKPCTAVGLPTFGWASIKVAGSRSRF